MRQHTKRAKCLVEASLLSNGPDHSFPLKAGGEIPRTTARDGVTNGFSKFLDRAILQMTSS